MYGTRAMTQCFTETGWFFLSLWEEMYSFYIHSCWPFIEVGLFCFIGRPRAEQEGFLLSTETQINCALNQINAHLKRGCFTKYSQNVTIQPIWIKHRSKYTPFINALSKILVCWCITQAEAHNHVLSVFKWLWFALYTAVVTKFSSILLNLIHLLHFKTKA